MSVLYIPRLLLFRGIGIVDTLIQFRTRSLYSHAGIEESPGLVIESYPGKGVRRRALSIAERATIDAFEIPDATAEGWQRAAAWASKELGSGYDWRGVWDFISRRPTPSSKRWFCSEFADAYIAQAGVNLFRREAPGGVDYYMQAPGDLPKSTKLIYDGDWNAR